MIDNTSDSYGQTDTGNRRPASYGSPVRDNPPVCPEKLAVPRARVLTRNNRRFSSGNNYLHTLRECSTDTHVKRTGVCANGAPGVFTVHAYVVSKSVGPAGALGGDRYAIKTVRTTLVPDLTRPAVARVHFIVRLYSCCTAVLYCRKENYLPSTWA